MSLKNTSEAYGWGAKLLHWLVAVLIITLLIVGFVMTGMANSPDKFQIYGLHKSFGIMVLALAFLRLGWKMANAYPALPEQMKFIEKFAARTVHAALYVLMVTMPLSGWLMSSAAGIPVSVFGWFTLPDLIAADPALKIQLRNLHGLLAYIIIIVLAMHVAAALLHHFYYKDNVLRRMLPFIK